MRRQAMRIRIDDSGRVEVVDPGLDTVALLAEIDPTHVVRQEPLPGFTTPRFLRAREIPCGIDAVDLETMNDLQLWAAHDLAVERMCRLLPGDVARAGEATLLSLKVELARRLLGNCVLCARRCGVDRLAGEIGACRLGVDATVAEHFVHIAEEAPINPSLVLNLAGCGLRCRYCQQGALLDPAAVPGEALDAGLWHELDAAGARSLSFVGGNPDESLFAILRFLSGAPDDWHLPIIWNCHAYASREVIRLLDGVVDGYVPDCKYGSEACGMRWSGVPNYPAMAHAALGAMLAQGVPVIVRILVLPGHLDCCHRPTIEALGTFGKANLRLSLRGQYCPDWQIASNEGPMSGRCSPELVAALREAAVRAGIDLVAE